MRLRSLVLATALLLIAAFNAMSQSEVATGDMDRPLHQWGTQILGLPLTNNVDYPKFVAVRTLLTFQGTYLNPMRGSRTNYILEPNKAIIVGVRIEIPPNYGVANLKFEVYDVVDTLDNLLPSQKVMDQAMQIRFQAPAGLMPYLQDRLTLTPMLDNNPYLGTEFARVMILMMKEGKNVAQIAKLAELDTTYVRQFQDTLLNWKFFARSKSADSTVVPAFPVLRDKDAELVRPLVEKTSTALSALIEKNLPAYRRVIDSMIKAGGLPADSDDFMSGGTVLYRSYPVVTALFLWYKLGQEVVGGDTPLDIYKDTDPCNAWVTRYLYGVQGGDLVNGNQYYSYSTATGRSVILFGDRIPTITCPQTWPWKPRMVFQSDYNYDIPNQPEMFTYDTTLVNPALRALSTGAQVILKPAMTSFKADLAKIGPDLFTQGTALWLWNQIASKTTQKLVAKGVIARRNNGQFRFESINGISMK
jgi:hypothetical protein